jgi:hypothetical protein
MRLEIGEQQNWRLKTWTDSKVSSLFNSVAEIADVGVFCTTPRKGTFQKIGGPGKF